jgi:hypothetical protein
MRQPLTSPDASFAPLVLDAAAGEPARRFRSSDFALAIGDEVDPTGLSGLRCSGSAQFSATGWDDIRGRVGGAQALHVIDLRQESHGFVGGEAVSWYAARNWGAVGLDDDESLALEALRLKLVAGAAEVSVADVRDVKAGRPVAFVSKKSTCVLSEAALVAPTARYTRLPVTDHARPRDAVVDAFVTLARLSLEGYHVHFHCRGGKGRTATFMALFDMLRNAQRVDLRSIVERQRLLNDYDLGAVPAESSPKRAFIDERRAFLERFYHFARAGADTWTEWLAIGA